LKISIIKSDKHELYITSHFVFVTKQAKTDQKEAEIGEKSGEK